MVEKQLCDMAPPPYRKFSNSHYRRLILVHGDALMKKSRFTNVKVLYIYVDSMHYSYIKPFIIYNSAITGTIHFDKHTGVVR